MRIRRAGAAAVVALTLAVLASCTHGNEKPTPVPSSTAPGPNPLPGGTNNPLGSKWDWKMPAPLALARQMRGGATFYEVERCDVEPALGQYDWSAVDSVVDRATGMGYRMMLKIRAGDCYGGEKVSEPRDGFESAAKTPSTLPTDMDGYRNFVSALVKRYAAKGVHEYAVENEIDTANFWAGSFQDFATLAKTAGPAIRAADPRAQVLDPGLSSTAYGAVLVKSMLDAGQTDQALSFYQSYYQRRQDGGVSRFPRAPTPARLRHIIAQPMAVRAIAAADTITGLDRDHTFDVYQLHFYEPVTALPSVLGWIREHNPLPVEAWEVGIAWPGDFDPRTQAADTVKLTAILLGDGVRRVVYLPLAPTPKAGKTQIFRGLADPDGTVTPAGKSFEKLAGLLTGDGTVRRSAVPGLSGIAVTGKQGTEFVVWSADGKSVDLRTDVAAESATGAPQHSVIGDAPVFIHRDEPLTRAQRSLLSR